MKLEDGIFYAINVVKGNIIVCNKVRLACQSPFVGPDYVFDFEANKDKGTHEKFPLKYQHD